MAAEGLDYDEARLRLERASLAIEAEGELDSAHQAALLAAARCGLRMFKGGVFISPSLCGRLMVGQERPRPIVRALRDLGVQVINAPEHAVQLSIGHGGGQADLHASCAGWTARIGPACAAPGAAAGNVLSGAAAGALGVAELFRKAVLDDVLAAKRPATLDLWGPGQAPERIGRLPKDIWMLGLGNLGQATLFVLSLLPWEDPADALLLLNDPDVVGPENLSVQVLTQHDWVGQMKARIAARWAEDRGFRTVIHERRFAAETRPTGVEPRLALVGVDNLDARRWAAGAGFDLVIDAGLGATGPEAFDIRIHVFPGSQTPAAVWPELAPSAERPLSQPLARLVEQGRLDLCGAMTIAGTSVGVPCTAMVAAALQVAQACRALATGQCADRVDLSLADLRRASWRQMPGALERVPLSLPSLAAGG
jgi:hypothetical protein